jgi:hypothetical protein
LHYCEAAATGFKTIQTTLFGIALDLQAMARDRRGI